MKSKDVKRAINASIRATYKSNRKMQRLFEREVTNPIVRHLKNIPQSSITPAEVIGVGHHLVYSSEIYFPFTEHLYSLEIDMIKNVGGNFLKQMEAIKTGKKVWMNKAFIIADKKDIQAFNYRDAVINLNRTLKDNLSLLRSDLQSHALKMENSIVKKIDLAVNKVNFERKVKKANLITQLRNSLNKQVKKYIKFITSNKSLEAFSKGNDMSAKIAAQAAGVKMTKKWVTMFDHKVRNWHDRANFQTRRLDDLFDVPFPGGHDRLMAPKMPPISPENYYNCRCVVAYKVLKK